MVFRCRGWRLTVPAAACLAVAGMVSARAMDAEGGPVAVTPSGAKLMWGGPVPKAPIPGRASVYVPSPAAYAPSTPSYQPPFEPSATDTGPAEPGMFEPEAGETEPRAASIAPSADAFPDAEVAVEPEFEPEPEADVDAGADTGEAPADPSEETPAAAYAPPPEEALGPLGAPVDVPDEDGFGGGAAPAEDPWAGLTQTSPGVEPPPPVYRRSVRAAPERLERRARGSYADLEQKAPPRRILRPSELPGRGALEREAPSGYQRMPGAELMCRRQLAKLGVRFVDATSIQGRRNCGVDYPVKITEIASGIAMRPAATLNCAAALRVAEWMKDEVKPAARWKLLKRPTALINASSYRCSRIAGSRSISEHASGNALDVAGFKFADGSVVEIEKKGFFDFREKAFQTSVRKSACEYFGTVLGPGYNRAHADHLHLDAKQRRRTVCK